MPLTGSSEIFYSDFDEAGYPHTQKVYYPSKDKATMTDDLTLKYVFFDSQKVIQIEGKRHEKNGQYDTHGTLYVSYDSNGNKVTIRGNADDSLRQFIINPEGHIVLKTNGFVNKSKKEEDEHYIYTPRPHAYPIGWFGDIKDENGKKIDFDLNFHPVSDHWPPPAPEQYEVQPKDTFSEIEEQEYQQSLKKSSAIVDCSSSPSALLGSQRQLV